MTDRLFPLSQETYLFNTNDSSMVLGTSFSLNTAYTQRLENGKI